MEEKSSFGPPVRTDGLQLEERRGFQERFWRVQRWAWAGFGLVVLAALAGLTGSGGPLSRATLELGAGSIDYPSVARWQAADSLTLQLAPGRAGRTLLLSSGFAESFEIETVHPAPLLWESGADGHRMRFAVDAGAPVTIHLHVRPLKPGLTEATASLDGGPAPRMRFIVLP